MRLIDCYIENFGGLSEYRISFEKELTVLMESNGFGKSTLAAFIKAMFYGFPKGAKSLEKNERKLYTPWQGGKFGGNLSFEHEGIAYRIERFFGATPKQDSFNLYELEPFAESKRFSEKIGLELFQLDVESYEKSTYMAQVGDFGSFATAGIQTKLGDLVEEADDIYNFDKAVASLKEKRSKYKAYKGQTGSIYEIKKEISFLQSKIAEKPLISDELTKCKRKLDELILQEKKNEIALEEIRKRITKASESAVLENLSKQYEELKQEKIQIKSEIEALLAEYKKGIPTKEDADRADTAADNVEKINSALNALHVSPEDQKIYEEYSNLFIDGIPEKEYLDNLQKQVEERNSCLEELAQLEAKKKAENLELARKIKFVLFSVTAVLFVATIVLFALKHLIPSVILAAVTLVMLIVSIIVKPKTADKPDAEQFELVKRAESADKLIINELAKYFPDKEISSEGYGRSIFELMHICLQYKSALKNLQDCEAEKKSYQQKRLMEEQIVENFAEKYGFAKESLTDVRFRKLSADIVSSEKLLRDLRKAEERIVAFENNNLEKLKAFVRGDREDIQVLKDEELKLLAYDKALKSEILLNNQSIAQKNKELEQFPLYEDELEENNSKYEEHIKACEIIDQTIDYLTRAKDIINLNFVKPIKERFDFYVNQILAKDNLNIFMDKELNVKPEQYGEAREIVYFSTGYTDIVRLCMHFALVDVLFEETDCFIILDDPFVNLDDGKTKEAIDLLKELSKRRQVVYMTCHSSRV